MPLPKAVDMIMEKFGGVIAGAFGPEAAMGFLIGLLDDVDPDQCYDFIINNQPLFPDVSDEDWVKFSKMAKQANLYDVDTARIIAEIKANRIDLYGLIINTPNGVTWLNNQVTELRSKLQLN